MNISLDKSELFDSLVPAASSLYFTTRHPCHIPFVLLILPRAELKSVRLRRGAVSADTQLSLLEAEADSLDTLEVR